MNILSNRNRILNYTPQLHSVQLHHSNILLDSCIRTLKILVSFILNNSAMGTLPGIQIKICITEMHIMSVSRNGGKVHDMIYAIVIYEVKPISTVSRAIVDGDTSEHSQF